MVTSRDPAPVDRDALIRRHLPLVRFIARGLQRRLSTEAEFAELVSAGWLGLVRAAEHFDPTRGLKFSTFAAPRIRGAMLDELRRLDPATRAQRRRARVLEATKARLAQALQRVPPTAAVAAALGVAPAAVHAWERALELMRTVPLDPALDGDDGRGALAAAEPAAAIDDRVSRDQLMARVRGAIAALPERERQALALTYLDGLPLRSVAVRLGVTESRVSQLRARALARLRARLAPLAVAA